MPDLDLVTANGPLRVFTLLHDARPVLLNTSVSPAASTSRRADEKGLYILVKPSGSMYWRYDFKLDTRQTMALGQYPAISLSDARKLHETARLKVKAGINPVEARQKEQSEETSKKNFSEVAALWRAHIDKKPRAEKTRDRDERMIRYLNEALGKIEIDQVRAKHLTHLLDTFEEADSFETRRRLQSTAINICGFAQGKAMIELNPFLGIAFGNAYTSTANKPRPAITEPKAFGELLRDVSAYQARQGGLVRYALELLALTFVRPGTVTAAEWSEFNLDKAMWTLPFAKLKQRKFRAKIDELKDKPHFVPLSRQAVELLRELKRRTGNHVYLFPGREDRPISTGALETALKAIGYKGRHVPHGFRSSASTLLNAERVKVGGTEVPRFAEQAIEFQLEHVDGSVAAIYNRDQRLRERAIMMQFWADRIDHYRAANVQTKGRPRLTVAA